MPAGYRQQTVDELSLLGRRRRAAAYDQDVDVTVGAQPTFHGGAVQVSPDGIVAEHQTYDVHDQVQLGARIFFEIPSRVRQGVLRTTVGAQDGVSILPGGLSRSALPCQRAGKVDRLARRLTGVGLGDEAAERQLAAASGASHLQRRSWSARHPRLGVFRRHRPDDHQQGDMVGTRRGAFTPPIADGQAGAEELALIDVGRGVRVVGEHVDVEI